MTARVRYALADGVATITMDDGKVNALSGALLGEVHDAFRQAEKDDAIVLLTGRPGIFSAGFDLSVFQQGPGPTLEMLRAGAELTEAILSFPRPVVTACNGHGYPMGAFLMLSADLRFAADGSFRIGMNEVQIGLTVPSFAVVLARYRLNAAYFHRTVALGEMFSPEEAITAGFIDHVVPEEELLKASLEAAHALARCDRTAHEATKLRIRAGVLRELRDAIETELLQENAAQT
jgi:enoyl-CoA hydratase